MTLAFSTQCQLKKFLQKVIPVFSSHSFSIGTAEVFRTSENDPGKHTLENEGLYYSINNSLSLKVLFKGSNGLLPGFVEECKTFEETPIMIRKPALEIINYLKNSDFEKPINKYVLYGKFGAGVSTTLAHIIHYVHSSNWLIVHVPRVFDFGCTETEICESTTKPGFMDLPAVGSMWLNHFKSQNLEVISKLNLRLQNDYKWNIQEENKAGESLLGLVDHGIIRGKYSCDVIVALLDEIKILSRKGMVKTLVAIDGYSSIFHPEIEKSKCRKIRYVHPAKVSCVPALKNMALADWHNGAAVLTCTSNLGGSVRDHYPLNRLTKDGFEFLDPFIPIEVPEFSKKEMMSMFAYYRSKNWIRRSDGDQELMFLSGGNPLVIRDLCGYL